MSHLGAPGKQGASVDGVEYTTGMPARVLPAAALGLALLLSACGSDPGGSPAVPGDSVATERGPAPRGGVPGMPEIPPSAGDLRDRVESDLEDGADAPRFGPGPVLGGDISWPQCPTGLGIPERPTLGLPMPPPAAKYVIIGLTNGPAFTPNPCLADQVAWVRERELLVAAYAVNSYPDDATLRRYGDDGPYDGSQRLGALRNVGYQQARYNLANMVAAGLRTPMIWLDVEPVPIFEWSDDKVANAAVVEGAARGYTDAGYEIGFYSTQFLWDTVVGDFALGIPEWRAAGETSRAEALARCGEDRAFQGGRALIGQWLQDNRDLNVTCPGVARELDRWFHQF